MAIAKKFTKKKFSEWYTQVDNALPAGVKVENINSEFKLTTIKPIHPTWIVYYYNHITSKTDTNVIIKGWKSAGIYDTIKLGKSNQPIINPFNKIVPLAESSHEISNDDLAGVSKDLRNVYGNEIAVDKSEANDDDVEWGLDGNFEKKTPLTLLLMMNRTNINSNFVSRVCSAVF